MILSNANVLDVEAGEFLADRHILIEDGRIKALVEGRIPAADEVIDLRGAIVMPGLIDAHVHVTAYTVRLAELPRQSPMYVAARAGEILKGMLSRGFTTVRDMGGADFGIAQAVAEGYLPGPRILYCGKALSPTGGHGDMRPMGTDGEDDAYSLVSLGRRCDGVPEVRRAARDEIRRGASHIKIMANGGTSSPNDRITSDQFSEEEIAAIADEAAMANLYVAAHTYTARCIARAVRNGVRSIEHANLIDEETIQLMKDRNAFMVPTLAAFNAYAKVGASSGVSADSLKKNAFVLDAGIRALEMGHRAGLQIAFGTDLIGPMHEYQLTEFDLRAEVMPPIEIIRSATIIAARLIREPDVGQVSPGFRADLLILDEDPRDKPVLSGLDRHISMVIKNGEVCLDRR